MTLYVSKLPVTAEICIKKYRSTALLEFLHCTPVGSKLGSYMPNMAMPDLNKC